MTAHNRTDRCPSSCPMTAHNTAQRAPEYPGQEPCPLCSLGQSKGAGCMGCRGRGTVGPAFRANRGLPPFVPHDTAQRARVGLASVPAHDREEAVKALLVTLVGVIGHHEDRDILAIRAEDTLRILDANPTARAALARYLAPDTLDVETLAKAAQDHETSGIHGPLHCSLACGATIAAEYARLRSRE